MLIITILHILLGCQHKKHLNERSLAWSTNYLYIEKQDYSLRPFSKFVADIIKKEIDEMLDNENYNSYYHFQ